MQLLVILLCHTEREEDIQRGGNLNFVYNCREGEEAVFTAFNFLNDADDDEDEDEEDEEGENAGWVANAATVSPTDLLSAHGWLRNRGMWAGSQ